MRWSWRVARVAGIGIYVHATFLFLLAWIALEQYRAAGSVGAVVAALLYTMAVFVIVVLHEYGHALTARRYGIQTRDITLLPIGGVARLERMPRVPRQELTIALAGPAVNVVLAAICLVVLRVAGAPGGLVDGSGPNAFAGSAFIAFLLQVNVWLAAFNLIPAFPMDGGRVLRALLAMRGRNYTQATEAAARVGRFFALMFGLVGLFVVNNPFLVFIALFVWLGAAGEAAAVQSTSMLESVPVGRLMITSVQTLAPHDSLARAIQLILEGFQQDFPVVEHGAVVGVLTRDGLLKALSEGGPATAVAEVMERDFLVAAPDEPVESVLARLRACHCQALPVLRGQQLQGMLTLDNVGEYVMVQTALRENPAPDAGPTGGVRERALALRTKPLS